MTDSTKRDLEANRAARELVCSGCGKYFIFRRYAQEHSARMGEPVPKRCPSCRKKVQARREKEAERIKNEAWQQKKAEEQREFDTLLKSWPVIPVDEVQPDNDRVLYIIGNGFDLMHGVKSSYYAFRDSLGKQNDLRRTLEVYLTPDDIWADFEDALAKFDISAMGSQYSVNDWLDMMDAYDEDAGAAEYFMAIEAAATPIQTVSQDLPRRFRMWVESLAIGTKDRPLQKMFRNGKVLCFNYTEFVEILYGIPEQNICYIHGCRRKKKGRPRDRLILGHIPGANDDAFNLDDDPHLKIENPYKRAVSKMAQGQVLQLIADYDADLTKNCREIIKNNTTFFSGLREIETVVTIGHAFSPVDWDYFMEVAANLSDRKNARWYFGCHGLRDLKNLEQLLKKLDIERSNVSVFRTDEIHVTPMAGGKAKNAANGLPKEKTRCVSPDGRWAVKTVANRLSIVDQERQATVHEAQFSDGISNVFFFHAWDRLAVIIGGAVFLFRRESEHWSFVDELEGIQNQSVLNPRLRRVFLTDRDLTFVYNSRVRKYSLSDGALIANQARRSAVKYSYEGEDISALFLQR